nr:hypothetical protein [Tanacetum cinerariifolium]
MSDSKDSTVTYIAQLLAAVSPTAKSPGYIADSDLKEDPKEDPIDYPADRDNDDEEEEKEEEPLEMRLMMRRRMRRKRSTQLRPTLSHHHLFLHHHYQHHHHYQYHRLYLLSSPPLPVNPTYPLGYRDVMISLRAETPFTSHPLPSGTPPSGAPPLLPIHLPTSSPPFLL